jgi:uncharacterized membrane protein YeaQ/YmgE (transglycosylase-associated protein family)
MNLELFGIWVLVGLIAGWLAGFMMKGGRYGLPWDLSLGLGGSLIGSWIFQALGISPGTGWSTMVVVASVGAAIVMVAQRKVWPALA